MKFLFQGKSLLWQQSCRKILWKERSTLSLHSIWKRAVWCRAHKGTNFLYKSQFRSSQIIIFHSQFSGHCFNVNIPKVCFIYGLFTWHRNAFNSGTSSCHLCNYNISLHLFTLSSNKSSFTFLNEYIRELLSRIKPIQEWKSFQYHVKISLTDTLLKGTVLLTAALIETPPVVQLLFYFQRLSTHDSFNYGHTVTLKLEYFFYTRLIPVNINL